MSDDSHQRGPRVLRFIRSRPIAVSALIVLSAVVMALIWAGLTTLSAPDNPSRKHTGALSAEVVDASEKPVADAKVVLTDSITKESSSTETGNNGKSKLAGLFPGNYEVHAEKGDFRSQNVNIQVSNNATARVRLVLGKK